MHPFFVCVEITVQPEESVIEESSKKAAPPAAAPAKAAAKKPEQAAPATAKPPAPAAKVRKTMACDVSRCLPDIEGHRCGAGWEAAGMYKGRAGLCAHIVVWLCPMTGKLGCALMERVWVGACIGRACILHAS